MPHSRSLAININCCVFTCQRVNIYTYPQSSFIMGIAVANNLNLFPCFILLRSIHLDYLISTPCFTSQIRTPTIICSGSYPIAINVESRRQVSKSVPTFIQEITEDLASKAALPCMDLSLCKIRLARCSSLHRRTRILEVFINSFMNNRRDH